MELDPKLEIILMSIESLRTLKFFDDIAYVIRDNSTICSISPTNIGPKSAII